MLISDKCKSGAVTGVLVLWHISKIIFLTFPSIPLDRITKGVSVVINSEIIFLMSESSLDSKNFFSLVPHPIMCGESPIVWPPVISIPILLIVAETTSLPRSASVWTNSSSNFLNICSTVFNFMVSPKYEKIIPLY